MQNISLIAKDKKIHLQLDLEIEKNLQAPLYLIWEKEAEVLSRNIDTESYDIVLFQFPLSS